MKIVEERKFVKKKNKGKKGVVNSYLKILLPTCSTFKWLNLFITQPSIYGVIVYFLLCHGSLNYCPVNIFDYWLALYHGLASRFAVKTTQALIDMCHNDARVRFVYNRRRWQQRWKWAMLPQLNSNKFVVYGQKYKVWVLIFLVRTSGTFCDLNWADLVKFSVLQQNRIVYSKSIQETLLSIS